MPDNDAPEDVPDDATRPMPVAPDEDATRVLPAVPRAPQDMPPVVAPASAATSAVSDAPPDRSRAVRVAIGLAIGLLAVLLFSIIAALLTSRGPSDPAASLSATPTASMSESPSESASPTASASPTPSPSPTPEPSPEPTETTPAGPQFTSFVAPGTAACPDESSTADVTITWTSSGAVKAWIGIATDNAKHEPYSEVPPSGAATLPFPCSNSSQVYTVTLEDAAGLLAHRSAMIERALP